MAVWLEIRKRHQDKNTSLHSHYATWKIHMCIYIYTHIYIRRYRL